MYEVIVFVQNLFVIVGFDLIAQNIIITDEAFQALDNFDYLKIADYNGVFDSSCNHADSSGAISLIQIPIIN